MLYPMADKVVPANLLIAVAPVQCPAGNTIGHNVFLRRGMSLGNYRQIREVST
jgi:hypothetical protein